MSKDIQSVINRDLYSEPQPHIAEVKQVIEQLEDKIVPLSSAQVQAINYLQYLQSRPLHNGNKPYKNLIESIEKHAKKTGLPGYFIRVIEALVPRPVHLDEKGFRAMLKEQQKS